MALGKTEKARSSEAEICGSIAPSHLPSVAESACQCSEYKKAYVLLSVDCVMSIFSFTSNYSNVFLSFNYLRSLV